MRHSPPLVGIFWSINVAGRETALLLHAVPLGDAEEYGDFLNYGGHYEYWDRLAQLGAGELRRRGLPTAPAWSEYEEWPRGRVVFHRPTQRFILYADRKLQKATVVNDIAKAFHLANGAFEVRSDRHYVSSRKASFSPPGEN